MTPRLRLLAAVGVLLGIVATVFAIGTAHAQKSGGVLKMSHFDSPASMSLREEATAAVNRPMMGVFNNLVMYKQDVARNSQGSIVPDLATGWSWSEDGTELTLPLRLQPRVKGMTLMVNSIYNGSRYEDIWLDR